MVTCYHNNLATGLRVMSPFCEMTQGVGDT